MHKQTRIFAVLVVTLVIILSIVSIERTSIITTNAASLEFEDSIFIAGTSANDGFGYEIANVGDINGDGFDDIAVTSPQTRYGGSGNGEIFLYFGNSQLKLDPTIPEKHFYDSEPANASIIGDGVFIPQTISGIGDFNNDGFDDFAVGDSIAGTYGMVYLFYGGNAQRWSTSATLTTANASFIGTPGYTTTGRLILGISDTNYDGYDDMLIGSSAGTFDPISLVLGGTNWGMAQILETDRNGSIAQEGASDNFGFSLGNLGDINGDTCDDFAIGARDFDNFKGKTYVFYGCAPEYWGLSTPSTDANVTIEGVFTSGESSTFIASAGDFNGDGYDDFVIGAPRVYLYPSLGLGLDGSSVNGVTYLFFGGDIYSVSLPNMTVNDADTTFTGKDIYDQFGDGGAGIGDINGDGFEDLAIGATFDGMSGAGNYYIFYGRDSLLPQIIPYSIADVVITGSSGSPIGQNSKRITGIGDFNNDGSLDFAISTPSGDLYNTENGYMVLILEMKAITTTILNIPFTNTETTTVNFTTSIPGVITETNTVIETTTVVQNQTITSIGEGATPLYLFPIISSLFLILSYRKYTNK